MSELFKLQPRVDVPGPLAVFVVVSVWGGRKIARLARILLCSPAPWIITALLVASVAAVHAAPWLVFVLVPWALCGLAFWRMNFPDGFRTNVVGRLRGTARSLFSYRYRWNRALKKSGVISESGAMPLLLRTTSTGVYDRLRVRMVAGQQLEDFTTKAERLKQTFNAEACRVSAVPNRPHWLDLTFLTTESLDRPVPPYPPDPDWMDGLPVATQEDGKPWLLKLIGNHLLVAGATGAGKSSVLWAIIDQLIPGVMDRLVRLWVLDPKGGMELDAGKRWFDRFACEDFAEFVKILEDAVVIMQRRQRTLRGVTRQHQPSTAEPLIVVVVDEMAALTSWSTDSPAQRRIESALLLLMSQGRAVGVSVIGAVQDPRKETIPMRGLFTIRAALRLNEPDEVRMVHGKGALDAGAKCHEIPKNMPGVGYVMVDGDPMPYRVRFAHVTDDMIRGKQADVRQLEKLERQAA